MFVVSFIEAAHRAQADPALSPKEKVRWMHDAVFVAFQASMLRSHLLAEAQVQSTSTMRPL